MNKKKPNGYWTFERCKAEALKYETRMEWRDNSVSSYNAAFRNKWKYQCCKHMTKGYRPFRYWSFERCKAEALKYKTRTEWYRNSSSSYKSAYRNKWMDQCCEHFDSYYWTFERCKAEALKYETRTEWRRNHTCSYDAAYRNKWIDQCCKHMMPALKGFDPTKPAVFYSLLVRHESNYFYAIGITTGTVQKRYTREELERITIRELIKFEVGKSAQVLERRLKQAAKKADMTFSGSDMPLPSKKGNNEIFTIDVMDEFADVVEPFRSLSVSTSHS